VGSLGIVLLQFFSDSNSEIILKIGQYLMKLRRTNKNVPLFWTTLVVLGVRDHVDCYHYVIVDGVDY